MYWRQMCIPDKMMFNVVETSTSYTAIEDDFHDLTQ